MLKQLALLSSVLLATTVAGPSKRSCWPPAAVVPAARAAHQLLLLTLSRAWLAPIWLSFFCSARQSNTTFTAGALVLPGTTHPYSLV